MSITVAFQGAPGAYSEDAITALWKNRAVAIASHRFEDVIEAVHIGTADYGVLPIENTIAGIITSAQDILQKAITEYDKIEIVDQITIPVQHALLAPIGATIEGLTQVSSHPAALLQCTNFLRSIPNVKVMEAYDTAGAAKEVALHNDTRHAAIAGTRAAERYNLHILAEDIQNVSDNQTRFVVIAKIQEY